MKIKPHKAGRTADFHQRITPADFDKLRQVVAAQGVSMADWLAAHVQNDYERLVMQAADLLTDCGRNEP